MRAIARVRAALAIAQRVADRNDPLGIEAREGLRTTSGLSNEGIELALGTHLERDVSGEDLKRFIGSRTKAGWVTVFLSGNVCVAALRAIALGLVTAPHVRVKPSRRDPTLAGILVRELAKDPSIGDGGSILEVDDVMSHPREAVHAYGSDGTLDLIRSRLAPRQSFWPHGTGFGVAVIGAADALEPAAAMLARDVIPFDQRGCLSPRVALVEGDASRARTFARELGAALDTLGRAIPRGRLLETEEVEVASYVEIMRAAGELFVGTDHTIGLDPEPARLWMGPASRTVHVAPVSAGDVDALLSAIAKHVATVGTSEEGAVAAAVRSLCPLARRAPLGSMQRPPLDGPVDLRTRPAFAAGGD